jgi:hypothetical protein
MKTQTHKLIELQEKLKLVIKDAKSGKLEKSQAAEKIIELREAIDDILKALKKQ